MNSPFRNRSVASSRVIAGLGAGAAAALTGVSLAAIHGRPPCRRSVARARQLAIYLHHVALGASVAACARQFSRDRATIRHAIARVEDLRENPAFNRCALRLERAVAAHRDMMLELLPQTEGATQ